MKRYSSFIINESTATEVEENSKEVKIQAKVGCWYAFYLKNTSIGTSVWFWKYVMKD